MSLDAFPVMETKILRSSNPVYLHLLIYWHEARGWSRHCGPYWSPMEPTVRVQHMVRPK